MVDAGVFIDNVNDVFAALEYMGGNLFLGSGLLGWLCNGDQNPPTVPEVKIGVP